KARAQARRARSRASPRARPAQAALPRAGCRQLHRSGHGEVALSLCGRDAVQRVRRAQRHIRPRRRGQARGEGPQWIGRGREGQHGVRLRPVHPARHPPLPRPLRERGSRTRPDTAMSDVAHKISSFITTSLLLDASRDIAGTDSFLEAGIIDSTGVLELVQFLEETWNISVKDEEMVPANLDSLAKLEAFVKRK